ncbi:TIGR03086 family metal-binding protein [Micromonospora sp. C81]|uniref:TIGR03086 family metal-binding protein n=1 Tax=Micromonospora TaxID=1873 RepID=UPI001B397A38|nr:TIGR03086 family metal-binding protein [Micromonospora sp. C81]MBQ1038827.1 TIGR03086 family protein [Micromonospora sp. C81]
MATQRQDYFDALDWVSDLATRVPVECFGTPTPCEDFDVRSLLGHLIGTAYRGLATARCTPMRDIPHVVDDVPDAELASTYARLAASIRTAWIPLAAAEEVRAPWGTCSAMQAAQGFTVETITHGWDLAVATGQPSDAPNGIAGRSLSYAGAVVPDRLRGVMYHPPVVDARAESKTMQLALLLGRRIR